VGLDGGRFHDQLVGDLGVGQTAGQEAEDLDLAGAVGAGMKLLSAVPEIALSHGEVASGSQTAAALTGMADATTLLALFPLALFCLTAGIAALRARTFPTWLGVGALIAGASLTVNGCFRGTENVPALLVFALWCLAVSVHLLRVSRHDRSSHDTVGTETPSGAPA